MKYYKIKVKREPIIGGGLKYVYPDDFHKKKKYYSIQYQHTGEPEEVAKHIDWEYVLIETTDTEKFDDVPESTAVTKTEADELKRKWTPKKPEVV